MNTCPICDSKLIAHISNRNLAWCDKFNAHTIYYHYLFSKNFERAIYLINDNHYFYLDTIDGKSYIGKFLGAGNNPPFITLESPIHIDKNTPSIISRILKLNAFI